jgi:hypothetical protein
MKPEPQIGAWIFSITTCRFYRIINYNECNVEVECDNAVSSLRMFSRNMVDLVIDGKITKMIYITDEKTKLSAGIKYG